MSDNRVSRRYRTWKTAHIVLDGGRKLVGCSITDISDTGTCLKIDDGGPLPRSFDLLFERDGVRKVLEGVWRSETGMVLEPCQVMWRNGAQLGVRFSRT